MCIFSTDITTNSFDHLQCDIQSFDRNLQMLVLVIREDS